MKFKKSYLVMAPAILMGVQSNLATSQVLEEVVVTATKRETSSIETPLSLETFSGEQIENAGIRNLEDLSAQVPNVIMGEGLTAQSIIIRGAGSGQERSFEQAVAMFVDDVYMPRSRQYRSPFFDVKQVEVLRGPQAVLFGLNATAGTVLINSGTTRAGDDSFLKLRAGYETEYAGYNVEAVAGGTLSKNLGARLAVRQADTGDGFFRNEFTGQDETYSEETVARLSLSWDVTDKLNLLFKYYVADAQMTGNMGEAFGATANALSSDSQLNWRRNTDPKLANVFNDGPAGFDHDVENISLRGDYNMDSGHVLTGVVSYAKADFLQVVNTAELPGEFFSNSLTEEYEQTALELRLASPVDRTLSYIAGVYIEDNELFNDIETALGGAFLTPTLGLPFPFAVVNRSTGAIDTERMSAFVQATWNISDTFRLIGGVRYTDEQKDYKRERLACPIYSAPGDGTFTRVSDLPEFPVVPPLGPVLFGALCGTPSFDDDRSSDALMPELIAQWDVSDQSVLYLKAAESSKSGGFAMGAPAQELAEYGDETATTMELGWKTRFWGGRAELNLAVFNTQFDDLQLNSFVNDSSGIPRGVVSNAGKSTSEGFEAELNLAASDWLTVGGSIGYLDAEYDDFENGPCYAGEPTADPGGQICDKSGDTPAFAPEYSGSLYANMSVPLGSKMLLLGGVTMSFSDDYFTDGALTPSAVQDSYERWDANIGIADSENTWSIMLIGRNLSDEVVNNLTQPLIADVGYVSIPRTLTLQGTYTF
jgi:iron complex outermembrane recepter protein